MNSRDTLLTELNVLEHFNPIVPQAFQGADYLMLGNLSPQVQRMVIERMEKRPKLIAMDTMNFWMDIALEELKKTMALVDVLIINDEEARQLSGVYSLVKAAKVIRAMGPQIVIIKKGEHGALLFHEENMFFAPALPLEDIFGVLLGSSIRSFNSFSKSFKSPKSISFELDFFSLKRLSFIKSSKPPPKFTEGL